MKKAIVIVWAVLSVVLLALNPKWALVGAILMGVVGFILICGAFPKSDKRYKTGYKNNAGFDADLASAGVLLIVLGAALIGLLKLFGKLSSG